MQADEQDIFLRTKALLDQLEEDRQKAKAKEAAEAWTKTAAVSLVVIAVLAAIAVQRGGGFSSRQMKHTNAAIYDQVTASDQWTLFQARSTKAHVYALGVDLARGLATSPETQATTVLELEGKRKRYEDDKKPAEHEARAAEALRDTERALADENAAAGGRMGHAILGYQAAVAISSIGLVMKKKPLWIASMVLGAAATAWMLAVLFGFAPAS